MTDLHPFIGGEKSFGMDVNDAGQVVGFIYGTPSGGFFFDGSTATLVGNFGHDNTRALAINNASYVVGYSSSGPSDMSAFLWRNGTLSDLNDLILPGQGNLLGAEDINDKGQIVGYFINDHDPSYHAFLLTPSTATPTATGRSMGPTWPSGSSIMTLSDLMRTPSRWVTELRRQDRRRRPRPLAAELQPLGLGFLEANPNRGR